MYLNILLKRKTEQTHNFPYNASTDIKTDKEHIHRGFKDHKGLSYSFNGSTKYSTDNKQLYQGHTKHYSPNTFNHNRNYDREYFNKFNKHPETRPIELYTEYKNRYPHLSPNEYSIQQWQTEKGTPNELNRVMRHDKTGRSLETIEADDNDYAQGLAKLEEKIKSRRQEIIEDTDYDNDEKKEEALRKLQKSIPTARRAVNKYKNPVVINPAIKKDEKYKFDDNSIKEAIDRDIQQKDVSMDYFGKKIKKRYESKMAAKSGIDDLLNNVDAHIDDRKEKANKIISLMAKGTSKRRIENKKRDYVEKVKIALKPTEKPPPRSPLVSSEAIQKRIDDLKSKSAPSTPVSTFRKQPEKDEEEDDDDGDDDKTVSNDDFNVSDTLKSSFVEGHKILDGFNSKPEKYSVFKNDKPSYTKLNLLIDKIQNKKEGTSDFKTLRTLQRELHYGKTLTYVHAPKK